MTLRKTRTIAGLLLQLVSFHAHAESEGAGDPFPFQAPVPAMPQARYAADAGQERFPDLVGRTAQAPVPVRMLAVAGSEAPLLSTNAAPGGFDEGTVALVQVRGLERYRAFRRPPVRVAQAAAAGR